MVEVVTGGADLIFNRVDGDHRYRIAKLAVGYLITARSQNLMGVTCVSEWLHKTEEAARAGVEVVIAMSAVFCAIQRGGQAGALLAEMEQSIVRHNEICSLLDDVPLVGEEVRLLREQQVLK